MLEEGIASIREGDTNPGHFQSSSLLGIRYIEQLVNKQQQAQDYAMSQRIGIWKDLDPNSVAPIIPVNTAMTILIQYVIHCRGPTFLGKNIFVELGYTCNFGKTI